MRLIPDCCTCLPFCSIVALFLALVQQVSSQREKTASLARFLHPPAPFSASELAFFESIFRFTYSPRDRSVGGKQKTPAMSKNPLPSYPSPTAATGELEIIIFSSSHIRFSTAALQTGCCKYPSYGGGCSFFFFSYPAARTQLILRDLHAKASHALSAGQLGNDFR